MNVSIAWGTVIDSASARFNLMSVGSSNSPRQKAGLAFWMERVLEECDRASAEFAPDPVHDLRVALRRCRSLVDGLMVMDPDPAWKHLKKAGKPLFKSLGELRDVHVTEEWTHHFDSPADPVSGKIFAFLALRETHLKRQAAQALQDFDRKQWRKWCDSLPRRASRLRPGSLIFRHLALERWTEAQRLQSRALRSHSHVAWHSLRIGIKRFRYIVENFLPAEHACWGDDLKNLQDLLGEAHDLDVLWATAQQANAFPDEASRADWHARLQEEREKRLQIYREKMVGDASVWQRWRRELPQGKEIKDAALQRLRRWASVLDPDFKHSNHVIRLATELYDGITSGEAQLRVHSASERETLRLAALLHDVGRSKAGKSHHKASYRLIEELNAPLGIGKDTLHMSAVVARYHRGALPRPGQKSWQGLSAAQRKEAAWLAGILRLANALDSGRRGRISHLEVQIHNAFVLIKAQGYLPRDRSAEKIAARRHLLELVCRRPILVKASPARPARTTKAGS